MAGPLQAISFVLLFAVLSLVLPMLSLLSNAAIGLVSLRLGWQRGLSIAIPSAAILAGISLIAGADPLQGFILSLVVWLPIVGLASILTKSVSWQWVLTTVFTVSVLGVGLFHLIVENPINFWQAQPEWQAFVSLLTEMQMLPADLEASTRQQILDGMAQILMGSLVLTADVLLVLSIIIARFWQAQLYNPGGFKQEWLALRVGQIPAIVMLGLIGLALFGGLPWAIDMVLAGLAVFIFQGLAMLHALAHANQWHNVWLIGIYILLAALTVHIAILLGTLGIVDSFADFRKYFKTNRN